MRPAVLEKYFCGSLNKLKPEKRPQYGICGRSNNRHFPFLDIGRMLEFRKTVILGNLFPATTLTEQTGPDLTS
jgi:hypothetical protein